MGVALRRGLSWLGAAAAAVAVVSVLGTGAIAGGELPVRKAGLWKITSISDAMGMVSFDACIGPDDSIAAVTSQGDCAAPEVEHAGDQVIVNVTCTTRNGREKTSTLFTGDFTTWYRGIVKISSDPPAPGRAFIGVTVDAKYVGNCPARP